MRTGRDPLAHWRTKALACRRRQLQGCWRMLTTDFGMSAYRRPLCWHIDGDNLLWHIDGEFFLHVDWNNFFACRRRKSCLACRREQSFLHVDRDNLVWPCRREHFLHVNGDNLLWHVDGSIFCMSTEAIFFACRRRQSCFACRRGQPFGMSTVVLACRRVVSRHWHLHYEARTKALATSVCVSLLIRYHHVLWICLTCMSFSQTTCLYWA